MGRRTLNLEGAAVNLIGCALIIATVEGPAAILYCGFLGFFTSMVGLGWTKEV